MHSGDSFRDHLNKALQAFALQVEKTSQTFITLLKEAVGRADSIFTPLQRTLLYVLLALVLCTLIIIGYSWKIYGKVINEKFVRPSTLKEIEELKLSVDKLKLPKEHSPRI
ncbi:uncharacterized protein LOC133337018 [Musca vetustissima]|uniref:uncharacterized protein LOC133337018 n=1 Tax=Musca vetustissima TaxID=27455 RepID=UPI002AB6B2DD|nr:uncharacterized protein LOC133337018 [Musca vetustissima]